MGTTSIVLVGMMASGKTTVGRMLAERLGADFLDSDVQVEARTGRTVAQIWESDGEAAFRRLEAAALRAALAGEGGGGGSRPVVVAAAGGAVLNPANRRLLAEEGDEVVWLRARPETLAARVGDEPGHRPLLDGDPAAALARLDAVRRPLYDEVATFTLDVDDLAPAESVDAIVRFLSREPPGGRPTRPRPAGGPGGRPAEGA